MANWMSRFFSVPLLIVLLLQGGCASWQQRSQQARFNEAYFVGDYEAAASAMAAADADGRPQVLQLLHQGEAFRLAGDFQQAINLFDRAEAGMKHLDTQGVISGVGRDLVSLLVNESSRDYRALMSEAILVNTYKALAFLAQANSDFARVEFNRADDRTRRAVDFFADDIREQREALGKQGGGAANAARSLSNDETRSAVVRHYGDPAQWRVYPEYMVPVSTYLHGLYFLANGGGPSELERAVTSLQRVSQMVPDNAVLHRDAELAEALAAGRPRQELEPLVWVLYENGLGPVLEEVRFEIPLFVSGDHGSQLIITAIALPRYRDRAALPGELVIEGSPDAAVETEALASMGQVIRTEVQARFPGILMRALASAVIKGVMQREAAESLGALGQFGAILYTVSTTQADLRSWQSLPDHWSVARVARPEAGTLSLRDSQSGQLGEFPLPNWPFTLVYVKRPTAATRATVTMLDLQGRHQALSYPMARGEGRLNTAAVADAPSGLDYSDLD
ncbi:COG3014 family protein [Marinobacter sp. SS21]|uniref:COG3014 family protein n=1 Tax=Marinobacter sp. SS21 TaxID=2979460 RepID=UPI00232C2632|nr:hypothetical protein [Marinobacter sp. SS21]MDC0661555.1 hypothetical protein [Marinobacter sp. SS21]